MGIEDFRKLTLDLIIVPYLCHIKKSGDTETINETKKWFAKCDEVHWLDDNSNFYNTRIKYAIELIQKKQIPPSYLSKIRSDIN